MSNQLSNGLLVRRRRRVVNADTLELVTNIQSTTASITCPAVEPGDLLLFTNAASAAGAPTLVTPSGFTLINNQLAGSGTFYRHSIFYKIATGAEDGASLAGMSGDQQLIGLGVFRKSTPVVGVTVSSVNAEGQFGTLQLADQTVAASAGTAPLLVIGNYGVVAQAVSSGAMSPSPDGSYQSAAAILYDVVKWKFYANAPANVAVSMDTTAYPSTNLRKSMRSFYLSLA